MKFLNYNDAHYDNCLKLFNNNCLQYFAENERVDYIAFLKRKSAGYCVGISDGNIVSAFGISVTPGTSIAGLSWILVSPNFTGNGMGLKMMARAKETALLEGASFIDITASQLCAHFFKKIGAKKVNTTNNVWGPGMHIIDIEISLGSAVVDAAENFYV